MRLPPRSVLEVPAGVLCVSRASGPGALALLAVVALLGCGATTHGETCSGVEDPAPVVEATRVLTVVGTNDLHGHVAALPVFGGHVANLRRARAASGGAVLLVDGGDLFQGTLESNLGEGAVMIEAYNALGYTAVTVGNHEFDYGPVGPAVAPASAADDPRGALLARAREARFPLLAANLRLRETGGPPELGPIVPTAIVDAAGIRVGLVGVTTEETLETTLAANVADLAMAPLADTIVAAARELRAAGARLVLVAAHAGGECDRFDDPRDLGPCDPDEEIFRVVRALPPGAVDLVVAGHTHQGVAHVVGGTPVIESFAYGRYFGRVDFTLTGDRVTGVEVFPPQEICSASREPCLARDYEGAPVVADAALAAVLEPHLARAASQSGEPVGVELVGELTRAGDRETALGNWFADLMLEARPGHDAALVNGGGLRASLPAGPLSYGSLYRLFPFDNRFAVVHATAGELSAMIARNLAEDRSIVSLGGLRARARCGAEGRLEVALSDGRGRPIPPTRPLRILTSDFVATGGDSLLGEVRDRPGAVVVESGSPIRDELARVLGARPRTVRADDRRLHDPRAPRLEYPGRRPVDCAAAHAP